MTRRRHRLLATVALSLAALSPLAAAVIHSNGRGGGPWSQTATWHGGRVPGADDEVVIAMRDVVVCDSQADCARLDIDPEGVLRFATGPDDYALTVGGSIESYGIIKLDGSDPNTGSQSLRLAATAERPSSLRLLANGALLAYGREGLAAGDQNVVIIATTDAGGDAAAVAEPIAIVAARANMLDVHNAQLSGVMLQANGIDNTGNKANERLNIVDNLFRDGAGLSLAACDTAVVRHNRFTGSAADSERAAIRAIGCKLTEIVGNHISGGYRTGIAVSDDSDSRALGNVIEDCGGQGIYWRGQNAMIKDNEIRESAKGIVARETAGVIEGLRAHHLACGIELTKLTMQLTNCRVEDNPEGAVPLKLEQATVTLLNCNIADDQIVCGGGPAAANTYAQCMQYLVVKVNGDCPPEAFVELRTAEVSGGPPTQGRADLNIRNSPVSVSDDGLTPLPSTMKALMVRSWRIDGQAKVINAPFYDLLVLLPQAGQPPRQLSKVLVEPDDSWFREELDARLPTLEVTLP